ncbi:uncharacterized protein LOC106457874 [Limulus polyphemus]|uniref:Uncharacterized protein LOC106457874 n=1 Tax=Limulus polyphemus TaxID=6850 RepID=A0ABM1B1C9_LIMPO|nr:uncharacterized protein LOC106457874 [Limulus polyphemus]
MGGFLSKFRWKKQEFGEGSEQQTPEDEEKNEKPISAEEELISTEKPETKELLKEEVNVDTVPGVIASPETQDAPKYEEKSPDVLQSTPTISLTVPDSEHGGTQKEDKENKTISTETNFENKDTSDVVVEPTGTTAPTISSETAKEPPQSTSTLPTSDDVKFETTETLIEAPQSTTVPEIEELSKEIPQPSYTPVITGVNSETQEKTDVVDPGTLLKEQQEKQLKSESKTLQEQKNILPSETTDDDYEWVDPLSDLPTSQAISEDKSISLQFQELTSDEASENKETILFQAEEEDKCEHEIESKSIEISDPRVTEEATPSSSFPESISTTSTITSTTDGIQKMKMEDKKSNITESQMLTEYLSTSDMEVLNQTEEKMEFTDTFKEQQMEIKRVEYVDKSTAEELKVGDTVKVDQINEEIPLYEDREDSGVDPYDTQIVTEQEQIQLDMPTLNVNESTHTVDPKGSTNEMTLDIPKTEDLPDYSGPHTPEEEDAAVKIQSAFRGFIARKQYLENKVNYEHSDFAQRSENVLNDTKIELLHDFTETGDIEAEKELRKDKHAEIILKEDERVNVINLDEISPESLDEPKPEEYPQLEDHLKFMDNKEDTQDSLEEDKAAIRIQAAFRGYKVRREMKHEHPHIVLDKTQQGEDQESEYKEEEGFLTEDKCQEELQKHLNTEHSARESQNDNFESTDKLLISEFDQLQSFIESHSEPKIYLSATDEGSELGTEQNKQQQTSTTSYTKITSTFGLESQEYEDTTDIQLPTQQVCEVTETTPKLQEDDALLGHPIMPPQKEAIVDMTSLLDKQDRNDTSSTEVGVFDINSVSQSQVSNIDTSEEIPIVVPLKITGTESFQEDTDDVMAHQEQHVLHTDVNQTSVYSAPQKSFEKAMIIVDETVETEKDPTLISDEHKEIYKPNSLSDTTSVLEDSIDILNKLEPQSIPDSSTQFASSECAPYTFTTRLVEEDSKSKCSTDNAIENITIPFETEKSVENIETQQAEHFVELQEAECTSLNTSASLQPLLDEEQSIRPRASCDNIEATEGTAFPEVLSEEQTVSNKSVTHSNVLKDLQQLIEEVKVSDAAITEELNLLKEQNEDKASQNESIVRDQKTLLNQSSNTTSHSEEQPTDKSINVQEVKMESEPMSGTWVEGEQNDPSSTPSGQI